MRAWHVAAPGPVAGRPLRLHPDDETPRPGPGELLLRVLACGVCRTDLHVTEGDLPPHRPDVTPGHEVVGEVVALARGATVHVLTRGEQARRLALELGAASAGDAAGLPPEPLDAAIMFAPVGDLVLPAMQALDRGGTLSVAGIHLSDIPPLNYA